jgi:hypothetical protein
MAFTKFGMIDGIIVYRSTGQIAKGVTNINPRTGKAGNTVYRNGRKVGTIGKGTAKEQQRIKEQARKRETKAVKETIKNQGDIVPKGDWESIAFTKKLNDSLRVAPYEMRGYGEHYFITVESQRMQNFASTLNRMVDNGYISVDDANDYWNSYVNGDSDLRSDLWREMDQLSDEYGLPPSDPIDIFTNYG